MMVTFSRGGSEAMRLFGEASEVGDLYEYPALGVLAEVPGSIEVAFEDARKMLDLNLPAPAPSPAGVSTGV